MSREPSKPILIAGGGIAGLTAALAFARRGFTVEVFEQTEALEAVGAGIQLSPNATATLRELCVLDRLLPYCVRPDAVVLRRASDLSEIARVPLGEVGELRWGAPYLVCHRADLQKVLLEAVEKTPAITLTTGASVRSFELAPPSLTVDAAKASQQHEGALVVAADGVWSAIRAEGGKKGESRFVGQLAWRRTISVEDAGKFGLPDAPKVVTAYLHQGFHLVAYPMRGGQEINLVAFTAYRQEMPAGWSGKVEIKVLKDAMQGAAPALLRLKDDGDAWTCYPIHVADLDGSWSDPGGLALIGDAAHAMTPFAAQGAAMAIEDGYTLASAISAHPDAIGAALKEWTIARRRRVLRVARRGAVNHFAWHAMGPVQTARDTFLRWRGPEKLAADLDWLYGWKPPENGV